MNWIKCSDRLPEVLNAIPIDIIFYSPSNGVTCGTYQKNNDGESLFYENDMKINNVTHWMPLPSAPED